MNDQITNEFKLIYSLRFENKDFSVELQKLLYLGKTSYNLMLIEKHKEKTPDYFNRINFIFRNKEQLQKNLTFLSDVFNKFIEKSEEPDVNTFVELS